MRSTSCVVRAALDDAPLVEHDDLVGVAHGGDAVRHDEATCGWRMHLAQAMKNLVLGVGVHRRQRIVEDQDAGFGTSARASAVRCFWPPDSVMPRSPTSVS